MSRKSICAGRVTAAICRHRQAQQRNWHMAAPIKFGVGHSVRRKEDDALIRGKGRYTDDVSPSPAMHALMLRSPHAHAKFTINVSKARGMPGVGAVLTADDVRDLGD